MKIAITGALGGVGRSLVGALRDRHELVGIVRSRRSDEQTGIRYVAFSEASAELADAECVVHSALDAKAGLRKMLPVNRELNRQVLDTALSGRCSLYVFVSSWVTYSTCLPGPRGYEESQAVDVGPRSDAYTRLKIESEREVIERCTAAGVGWLILRPTIVMGPGMLWSDRIAEASRWGLAAIRNRTVNAVHVDDLAIMTARLIDRGVRDEILNVGGCDLESESYFETLGKFAQRRPRYLPDGLVRVSRPLIPSSMWFLNEKMTVNLEKLEKLAGPVPRRPPEELFHRWTGTWRPKTLDELKIIARSTSSFKAHGHNYSSWFMPSDPHCRISLADYKGIINWEPGRITVKAGTRLDAVCDYLDDRGEALATLPEYLGISAGACFFVDVHGSSSEHFSLYETIEEIRYLDPAGEEVVSPRDEDTWRDLRRRRSRFIVTELTFRTFPATLMSNRIAWGGDAELERYLSGGWRDNYATTIQWFPRRGRFLVYNINIATKEEARAARRAFTPFRGLPYGSQRMLLGLQRGVQVDRWHRILGPWRKLVYEPFIFRGWTSRGLKFYTDVEMLFTIEDGVEMMSKLRQLIPSGKITYGRSSGIGLRFTHDPKSGQDYVWIEIFGKPETITAIVELAQTTARRGVYFHGGKTLPVVPPSLLVPDALLV